MKLDALSPATADRVSPPQPAPSHRRTQIYGIDLIRFAAASLVAFYHLGFASWASPHAVMPGLDLASLHPAAPLLGLGWIGVEIFFVISGFVIAYSAAGSAPLAFARSRFLRLWPAVLVCATLSLPAALYAGVAPHNVVIGYVHSLTFFPHDPWIATAYWSLPVEIVFYAMVFALIACDGFRFVEVAAYALGGVSASIWFADALLPATSAPGHVAAALVASRYGALMLLHHGVYFAIGVTGWLVATRGWTRTRAIALTLFGMAALAEIANQATMTAGFMHAPVSGLGAVALFVAGMAAIAISVAANERIGAALAPVLPVVRLLGLASYPLYLLHEPIGEAAMTAGMRAGLDARTALFAGYALALALAIVVARHVEPALRGWMQVRFVGARKPQPADRPAAVTAPAAI